MFISEHSALTDYRILADYIQFEIVMQLPTIILPSALTLAGSEFHTVGAATEKAWVPAFVERASSGFCHLLPTILGIHIFW